MRKPTLNVRFVLLTSVIALLALSLRVRASFAQEVTAHSSLILAPTAEMPGDGVVRLSGGFINGEHSTLRGTNDVTPYGASIGFLPFLELGFRFNRRLDSERQALGDRLLLVRVQALSETEMRPAVAIGAHDFLRSTGEETRKFNALYIVATKHFDPALPTGRIGLTLGYGSDIIDARAHQYKGVFGGVSAQPHEILEVMIEHDAATMNVGLRARLFSYVRLMVGLQALDTFVGGAAVQFRL